MTLTIEICPREPRATVAEATPHALLDLADCIRGGDAEPMCAYVRDHHAPAFRIIARNAAGEYENREATAEEKAETCRAIYFDSETEFDDEETAELYLIWQAADEASAWT